MFIQIDDDYAIAADSSCWMIQKKITVTRDGVKTEGWKSLKWFGSIGSAIKELVELRLRTSDVSTLAEALEFNKSVVAGIVSALSPDIEVTVK